MKKLRLFQIRDTTTNKFVPDMFFVEKKHAKYERDLLNEQYPHPRYVVSYGPDHRRFTK